MTAILTNMFMLQDAKARVLAQNRLPKPNNPTTLTLPLGSDPFSSRQTVGQK